MFLMIFLAIYFIIFLSFDICFYLKDVNVISNQLKETYPLANNTDIKKEAHFEARMLPRFTLSVFAGFLFGFVSLSLIFIFNQNADRLFNFLSKNSTAVSAFSILIHTLAIIVYIFLNFEVSSEERTCYNIKRGAFVIAGIFTSFTVYSLLF